MSDFLTTVASDAGPKEPVPVTLVSGGADIMAPDYETLAASQTLQVLGATGAVGDFLAGILVIPASTSPGAISIKDGSGSAITVFAGGANSVSSIAPFAIPLGFKSTSGGWQITTGANLSAIAVGDFT